MSETVKCPVCSGPLLEHGIASTPHKRFRCGTCGIIWREHTVVAIYATLDRVVAERVALERALDEACERLAFLDRVVAERVALERALDEACERLAFISDCPLETMPNTDELLDCNNRCSQGDNQSLCWRDYFLARARRKAGK